MQKSLKAPKKAARGTILGEIEGAILPRARVLVVDDDRRNLLTLGVVLEQVAEVVFAQSGEDALRYLLKEEFAVILLDVFMPGLDGYETARLIRQREQSKRTPIIFLTAINKEEAHMLRGYDTGAVDYVFKPFEPTILRSKVAVFVDLYEKTREIQQKAILEQQLMAENHRANSEKLLAEQALRRSEQRQALIMGSLPLGVYIEEQGAAERVPRFIGGDVRGLTGFAGESFARDPSLWTSRIHPDDRRQAQKPADLHAGHGATITEYRWKHADGAYRYFLDHAVWLPDLQEGEPVVAGTLRDVTERRQLEDQLVQSQKLDAIGKLTGGIAHDFNNLLASILSGLVLIERRVQLDDDTRRIAEMTRHAAKQGADLISRMLAFSRRQQLRPDVVEFDKLSNTMNGLVSSLLGGLIRLDWKVQQDVWPAFVDSSQLELALMNLILNARDAMPSGGTITISIDNRSLPEAADELRGGDYVVLRVEDTGCGIAPENLSRVIEPFYTTKEVGKGTGLGLSTAYGFARQSEGVLRVESVLDRGTAIELWLPRSMKQPAKVMSPEQPAAPPPVESEVRTDRVILLVDDSASLRDLTARLLADSGFEVVSAASGDEALSMIKSEPERFDYIITDFAMPVVTGLDVIRFARKLRPDWPAIIITGYANASDIADRPADVPLVTKPFTDAELLSAIGRLEAAGQAPKQAASRTGSR